MEMYQKISKISDEQELLDVTDELTDRFGNIPKETERLLDIVKIKYMATSIGINTISERNNNIILELNNKNSITPEIVSELVKLCKGRLMFSAGMNPYLTLLKEDNEDEILRNVKFVLQSIIKLKN
jgi:transcription-repair coupling factor (superfamily II helicase)